MAAKKDTNVIVMKPIEVKKAKIRIVGDTSLITHAWNVKAKRDMLIKQIGFPVTKSKDPKSPIEDFAASMYWLTPMPEEFTPEAIGEALAGGARFGFPVTAFKQAAISAAYRMGWAKDKASLRSAFFIEANSEGYYGGDLAIDWENKKIDVIPNMYRNDPMVEIISDPPVMREDMVRIAMGTADIRYRGEFRHWYADLVISYNANGPYSLDQIVNIINAGGYACGVGEWRPERDGQNGMFHVE